MFFIKQGNPTFCSFSLTKYVRIRKPHPFFPFALGMMVPSHLRWTNKTTLPKSRKTFKLIPILRVQPCQPPPMPQISDTLWMEHRGFPHGKTWEKLVFVSDFWNSHGKCKVVWLWWLSLVLELVKHLRSFYKFFGLEEICWLVPKNHFKPRGILNNLRPW